MQPFRSANTRPYLGRLSVPRIGHTAVAYLVWYRPMPFIRFPQCFAQLRRPCSTGISPPAGCYIIGLDATSLLSAKICSAVLASPFLAHTFTMLLCVTAFRWIPRDCISSKAYQPRPLWPFAHMRGSCCYMMNGLVRCPVLPFLARSILLF